jgi:hypothetical protein
MLAFRSGSTCLRKAIVEPVNGQIKEDRGRGGCCCGVWRKLTVSGN